MIHLVEELVLLTIQDDGRVSYSAGSPGFRLSLIGACLFELNEAGRIDVDLEKVSVLSTEPTGHAALDLVLKAVAAGAQMNAVDWICALQSDFEGIVRAVLRSIAERGVLEQKESRFLWVMKSRRYPIIDGHEQTEAKLRVVNLLMGDALPTPHDSVLIGFAAAGGLLHGFLSAREIERLQERISTIGSLDLIAASVEQAILNEAEALAAATLFMH
ncbi:MAG: hypothetical protein RL087_4 [Pseudomonadota bacterium]